jgi:hypothetical protein
MDAIPPSHIFLQYEFGNAKLQSELFLVKTHADIFTLIVHLKNRGLFKFQILTDILCTLAIEYLFLVDLWVSLLIESDKADAL